MPDSADIPPELRRQSFGATAREYDRYRPGYPAELIRQLLESHGATSGSLVLDIGAGTGQLASRVIGLGFDAVGVEPDDRMRAVLAENIGASRALEGSAERIPLADASVDAVLAGQMWHWVDPAIAVPEVVRVLRPGGFLTVLWILRDDRVPWVSRLVRGVTVPDPYQSFDNSLVPELGNPFGPSRLIEFAFEHVLSPDDFIAGLATVSSIALAPDRDEQLEHAREMLEKDPDIGGVSEVVVPYVCKTFTARRLQPGSSMQPIPGFR